MTLTIFQYWVLIASMQMGVVTLPIEVDDQVAVWAWAAYDPNTPPHYEITTQVLEYGNREFIRQTAYHEVCHFFLGHSVNVNDEDVVQQHARNEVAANLCVAKYAGITAQDIKDADQKALNWEVSRVEKLK